MAATPAGRGDNNVLSSVGRAVTQEGSSYAKRGAQAVYGSQISFGGPEPVAPRPAVVSMGNSFQPTGAAQPARSTPTPSAQQQQAHSHAHGGSAHKAGAGHGMVSCYSCGLQFSLWSLGRHLREYLCARSSVAHVSCCVSQRRALPSARTTWLCCPRTCARLLPARPASRLLVPTAGWLARCMRLSLVIVVELQTR